MNQRIKVMGIFAFFGFIAGAIAYFGYTYLIPALIMAFPQIVESGWILWGIGGAILATLFCAVYSAFPET